MASLIQRAARAANLISSAFGRGHYDVTMPAYEESSFFYEGSHVTLHSITTPGRTNPKISSLDVPPLPPLDVCSTCHPAAYFYFLTDQMVSRFDAGLEYVVKGILDGASLSLYTVLLVIM